jgi:antitoxin (DNA-binding transcriptional repressor) of toxin-antitoxin stability system
MEKTIGAYEARRQFGQITQDVAAKGTIYIVERHGQPVAAVVPMHIVESWHQEREQFFDQLEDIQRRANLSEQEAEALAAKAVAASRARVGTEPESEVAGAVEVRL